eukprot:1192863-Prorocentrum_minimum.AAC.2
MQPGIPGARRGYRGGGLACVDVVVLPGSALVPANRDRPENESRERIDIQNMHPEYVSRMGYAFPGPGDRLPGGPEIRPGVGARPGNVKELRRVYTVPVLGIRGVFPKTGGHILRV